MRRKQIPIEELASLPSFAVVNPSWSRDKVAFYWNKTGRFELYLLDLRTRETVQVTDGEAPRQLWGGFVWTRDDASIIFAKDQDGDEQNNLFRLNLEARKVTQLNNDPNSQEYPGEVTPDNQRMIVSSNRSGQLQVWVFDLESRAWKQMTEFDHPAWPRGWSPDGEWLAFLSNESDNLINQDCYIMRADGSDVRKIFSVRDGSEDVFSDWHPDGRRAAVFSDAEGAFRPAIVDITSGEVQWLGQAGVEEYTGRFSKDGRWLATIRNQDASLRPVLYEVESGAARELNLPPGFAVGTHFVLDDTKLLIEQNSPTRRNELLLYDLASDTYETLVAADYGSIDPTLFVEDAYISYPSSDGRPVPSLLYTPRDIEPGERLPALIVVHGGPTGQFFRAFDPYAQFLADQGYVVLEPNVRGSTGYGNEWRDMCLKDWGGGDLEDVAAGAEYLKSLPYVDPARIGVFGGSYGGFMSYIATVKRPDLFKVGIPWVGMSDLLRLYEESMEHFRYYLTQQMGDPAENPELWRDRSAITHADKLQAKLLIIHGMNDPRCPITQARSFRDRLLELGKREGTDSEADFEYHEFSDEGHGSGGDIQGALRTYRLLADFLERRL